MIGRPLAPALAAALLIGCAPEAPEEPAPAAAPSPVLPRSAAGEPAPARPPESAPAQPAGPLRIRITGHDYRWLLRYPGPDGRLDTPDDVRTERNLHLPARREVILDLVSDDWVYTFYVPYLDVLESAVPDAPFEIDFETGPAGVHDLLGSQMCGYTHPLLLGDVVIEEAGAFEAWLASNAAAPL